MRKEITMVMQNSIGLPEGVPPPYTEVAGDFNMRMREIECQHCHYRVMSILPMPRCGLCRYQMITVIRLLTPEGDVV